jgi:hypothetical protein
MPALASLAALSPPACASGDGPGFDHQVYHELETTITQRNPLLKRLFGPGGDSALCGPTTLANLMPYLRSSHVPAYPGLRLPSGLDAAGMARLVREFNNRCYTDPERGTSVADFVDCVGAYFRDGGYAHPDVVWIGDSPGAGARRVPRASDVRAYLDAGYAVVVEVNWASFGSDDGATTGAAAAPHWRYHGAHYIAVMGYEYDDAWGEQGIRLRIVDPEVDYSRRPSGARWDLARMLTRYSAGGKVYPPGVGYFLTGVGISDDRGHAAVVQSVVAFLPEAPASSSQRR